jgi:hypothetical protein
MFTAYDAYTHQLYITPECNSLKRPSRSIGQGRRHCRAYDITNLDAFSLSAFVNFGQVHIDVQLNDDRKEFMRKVERFKQISPPTQAVVETISRFEMAGYTVISTKITNHNGYMVWFDVCRTVYCLTQPTT